MASDKPPIHADADAPPRVRPIDPNSSSEVALVAARMRETLCEVLGEDEGREMYSMDALVERLRWHMDAPGSRAAVFLSEGKSGEITGHTIVRIERDESGDEFGLFTTTFVEPSARGQSTATALLSRGEEWMQERGLGAAVTTTARDNEKLISLFEGRGYKLIQAPRDDMVILSKELIPTGLR